MNRYRRNPGVTHGFRSGLESKIAAELATLGIPSQYESETLSYIKPARNSKYTPDFPLPNGVIIESKGRFVVEDRQKHLLLKEQHPDVDVRFVFSNSRSKISKNSKTTYAMWCQKHGFLYADKSIPLEWINEPSCPKRLAALEQARVKTK